MLNELTLSEARRSLAKGRISSVELVRACLARIASREPDLHAWTFIDAEAALQQARALDDLPIDQRGPLHGIPFGIKDVIDTVDMPTAYGSSIYAGYRPAWDAYCVTAIKKAGGIILGKHATSEFAYARPAPTANPHRLTHTPGGSSSGSAAAVADYMVPAALTTQTGGSTIRPAAYCGAVGFKPSFGAINRAGIKPLAESLDSIGIMARCVDDIALITQILAGIDTERTPISRMPIIGFCKTPHWSQVDSRYQTRLCQLVDTLAQQGAAIKDLELTGDLLHQYDDQRLIMNVEGARALAYERTSFPNQLSDALRRELDAGEHTPHARYDEALQRARSARRQMSAVLADIDFLITPSAGGAAPAGHAASGSSLFNRNWSLLQLPCITLPIGQREDGLPYGVQLVAAYRQDASLLAWARWVETIITRRR